MTSNRAPEFAPEISSAIFFPECCGAGCPAVSNVRPELKISERGRIRNKRRPKDFFNCPPGNGPTPIGRVSARSLDSQVGKRGRKNITNFLFLLQEPLT